MNCHYAFYNGPSRKLLLMLEKQPSLINELRAL